MANIATRNFKEDEVYQKEKKIGGVSLTHTRRLLSTTDGKNLGYVWSYEWDNNAVDPRKREHLVDTVLKELREDLGGALSIWMGDYFDIHKDVNNTNVNHSIASKAETIAKTAGYLEEEFRYSSEDKKMRVFLNSMPVFESTLERLDEKAIGEIKKYILSRINK